ncbi:MAG: alpha/beta hydrolase [Alphaproteobacteria bacterium]|nr:MAG: alpha/beta hydrolase [Alphaproteobacteria bacterium]
MTAHDFSASAAPLRHLVTADGVRIAWRDEGEGVPILCLPGLTRNMADFDALVAARGGRARFIRLDYRGRGASERPADWRSYQVPVEARDVLALMDHLGLERAAVVGTSRGGIIAMFLAATAGARLAGAFLNDVGPVLEPAGIEAIRLYLGRRPGWRDLDEAATRIPAQMPGFEGVPPERWRAEVARWWIETPQGLALAYDPRLRDAVFGEGRDAATPPDALWPLFDALAGRPVALLRGAGSNLLSAKTAAEMRRRLPDMLFAEVPGRGHVPFLDEPESLDLFDRWLAALEAAA